jgi:hypothetical protein
MEGRRQISGLGMKEAWTLPLLGGTNRRAVPMHSMVPRSVHPPPTSQSWRKLKEAIQDVLEVL